jgi:hypothetical protein
LQLEVSFAVAEIKDANQSKLTITNLLWLRIKNPPRHDVHVSCDGSFLAAATD